MKALITLLAVFVAFAPSVRAQDEGVSPAEEAKTHPEVPKEYELRKSGVMISCMRDTRTTTLLSRFEGRNAIGLRVSGNDS